MDEQQAPAEFHRRSTDIEQIEPRAGHAVRIRTLNIIAVVLAALLAVLAFVVIDGLWKADAESRSVTEQYLSAERASSELVMASDYLTTQARMYVVTGETSYLDAYLDECFVADRRGKAVETLSRYSDDVDAEHELTQALDASVALSARELHAMRLVAQADGVAPLPQALADVELAADETRLAPDESRARAYDLMINSDYDAEKSSIVQHVQECADSLLDSLHARQLESNARLQDMLRLLQVVTVLLVVLLVLIILATVAFVLVPLVAYTARIKENEPLSVTGAYELGFLAEAYNLIYEENRQRLLRLKYAADHDPLTGLFNRGAYDSLLQENTERVALLLVDVDKFKDFNDNYGHDVGDAVLKKVADSLSGAFRSTDYPCRIGGDEFAVIMTDIGPGLSGVIEAKIERVQAALLDTSDGVPPVTLSIGVAFSGAHASEDELYKAADSALYVVKERGRNGYAFHQEG